MLNNELPIYKTAYDMVRQMDEYIKNFTTDIRLSYGFKLREFGVEFIKFISMANNSCSNLAKRLIYLENACGILESYKFIKRLATDAKSLSFSQAATIDKFIGEIESQINGWKIKTEKMAIGK